MSNFSSFPLKTYRARKNLWIQGEPRRIAIFRALQLGDLLVAVPAIRAIRRRFPYAEITLIGLPWAASFAQRYRHVIDRFVEFPGWPGINETPYDEEKTTAFLTEQRDYHYDLAIQMHGSGRTSNPFVLTLQARVTAGYYENEPPSGLTAGAMYPSQLHEIERNLGLAMLLNCNSIDTQLEFPLFEDDYAESALMLRRLPRAGRPWVALHPGSRPPARRWPPEYFAQVGDTLARQYDAQIILTGGPGEEDTVQRVLELLHIPALNLAGQTSLGGLAAIISKLDLFVSNDTGPSHIACAVDTPSITIFGPADYQRWAPLNQRLHPMVRQAVPCSPCGFWECPIDHRCLRWLAPEQVIHLAERFLTAEPAPVQL